jgi:signal transduction histidine kinase
MARLLYITYFLLYTASSTIFAQTQQIDSLKALLETTSVSKQKVDILNNLSSELYNYDIPKAYASATSARELAKSIHYIEGLRYALILEGFYFHGISDYAGALRLFKQSSSFEKSDDDLKVYNMAMIGNVFQALAHYNSAEQIYLQAIDIQLKSGREKYLAYAYKNLARLYLIQWRNTEALIFFNKALTIYSRSNNKWAIADTWFSLTDVYNNLTRYDSAKLVTEGGCAIASELNDDFLKLYCLIAKGELDYSLGNYTDALSNYFAALVKTENVQLPEITARLYLDLGDAYEALGQNEVSLKYFFEALKVAERVGIKYEIAKIESSISWIYKNQNNFPLAHEFINKSLMLRQQIGDQHGVSNAFNIKGVIYLQQGKYDSSLIYLDKALEIRRRINHSIGVSGTLFNKALVLEEKRQFEDALKLQFQSLEIEEKFGNPFSLGISYNSIGNLYTQLKDFKKGLHYLEEAGRMVKRTGSTTLRMNNNYYLSQYYEAKGDFEKALTYHKKYAELNDSIYFDLGAGKLAELQALYQVEKKDQEIKLLNQSGKLQTAEIKLQKSKINFQNIVITSSVAGLLLVSLLAYKSYQYNKRIEKANREITEQKEEIQTQSEELIEANGTIANINKDLESKIEQRTLALTQAYKELDTFFYRASHDFRRPLTTFMGLAEVANVTVKDPNALELFDKVRDTATNFDKMLLKLQSISDVGSQELVYKEVWLKEIFDNVCDNFRAELQRKSIKTHFEVKLDTPFISYPAMVKIIIENLVENAIHFSGIENSFIKLKAYTSSGYISLDMQDNGQGIPAEYVEKIFEMYFRGSERSKGNGLGLYIVKKAIEKLNGSISVSSIIGVGTTFTVMIPNNVENKD